MRNSFDKCSLNEILPNLDRSSEYDLKTLKTFSKLVISITLYQQLWNKIEVPRDDRNSKSENMTSSGENGLNIRENARPKMGQDQVFGGVSVLCWLSAPVSMFYGNLPKFSKSVIRYLKILRMEIQNSGTTPNKLNQQRNVNTVRWESRKVTTQPGQIDGRKFEVIAFIVNAAMNSTANIFVFKSKKKVPLS